MGRHTYTFTISNKQTQHDICTICFSEWLANKLDRDLQAQHTSSPDVRPFCDGMVPGLDLTNTDRNCKKHAYYYEMAIPVARVFDVVRKQSLEDDSIELVLLSRSTDHARSGKNQLLEHAQQRVFIEEMTAGRAYAIYEAACPRFVTEPLLQLF